MNKKKIIGIIIALKQESKEFKKNINKKKKIKINNFSITKGYINNINIILIESGIGKVLASIATFIIIKYFKPNYILNIGTAGSLNENLKIYDIILVKSTKYHDVDLTTFGYKIGQIPKMPQLYICDKKIIKNIKKIFFKKKIKFINGKIISGDKFINIKKQKNKIKKTFYKSIAIDMEIASIGHTCFLFKKPFIGIKIISDNSDYLSKKNFKKNIKKISKNIYFLIKILLYNNI